MSRIKDICIYWQYRFVFGQIHFKLIWISKMSSNQRRYRKGTIVRLKQVAHAIAGPQKDVSKMWKLLYNVQSKLDDTRETVEDHLNTWVVNLDRSMPESKMNRWSSSRASTLSLMSLDYSTITDLGFEEDEEQNKNRRESIDDSLEMDPDKLKRLRRLLLGARSVIGLATKWQDQIKRTPALEEVSEADEEIEENSNFQQSRTNTATQFDPYSEDVPLSYHLWDPTDIDFGQESPPNSSEIARDVWKQLMETKTFEELFKKAEEILATYKTI
ncbi:uncharacterized protein LOC136028815 isoform X2 [Artemia franciscana]|uniref:uncharacterized protein LOC136028815 isoform X2 n=1 Tax=Artemia franciscana TaxID=6661 RepID=UPI0032DAC340